MQHYIKAPARMQKGKTNNCIHFATTDAAKLIIRERRVKYVCQMYYIKLILLSPPPPPVDASFMYGYTILLNDAPVLLLMFLQVHNFI